MLEGLEATEIDFSRIDERLDSDFYLKEYLIVEKNLTNKNLKKITELGMVTDGNHLTIAETFSSNDGIRYLRGQDISGDILQDNNAVYIPVSEYEKLKRSHIYKNDVLLTIVGANTGNTALVNNPPPKLTANCKLGIVRPFNDKINSHFLHVYLASKYGQLQVQRFIRGGGQTGLILPDFRNIDIVRFSKSFEEHIALISESSYTALNKSRDYFTYAESDLLVELDLADWQPPQENYNLKSFKNSFLLSGRLDAEFYQPKYDELEKRIEHYKGGYSILKNYIKEYSTGFPFDSDRFSPQGFNLIRISNIKKGYLDISDSPKIPVEDTLLSKRDIVKSGDLLLSMSGTIGNCCKVPEGIEAIINQRILKFSLKGFDPDVMALLLNSFICGLQLERIGTGGVQTNISSTDIFKIKIPAIVELAQKKISSQIRQGFFYKSQSKELLETAKRAVEIAIEKNEKEALKFINESV